MPIVISLFDYSGEMVEPWLNAGYDCYIVDIQHPNNWENDHITQEGNLFRVKYDLTRPWLPPFDIKDVHMLFSFSPCDHLAYSGNRWHRGKGLRSLAEGVTLFATSVEMAEWIGCPYMIENPESKIETHWRKYDYDFHPAHYNGKEPNDNYRKHTCIWAGNGFIMPRRDMNIDMFEDIPDDRIHKATPGEDRANFRSATPKGFATAVFEANCKNQKAA